MHHFWRLSEAGPDNLGLACTDDGLMLGRTALIERRNGRFVVRGRSEIERPLKRAYSTEPVVERFLPGLATVAAALNANDPCLARIAAVHLKIPDLPNQDALSNLEVEDALIKSADWNPELHPRTGEPPNPGWFAPTGGSDGESSPIRTAQNDEGDTVGGDALNAALSDVLEPGVDQQTRQDILNNIAPYANSDSDPAEVAQFRNLTVGGILLFSALPPAAAAVDAPSDAWKLGWAARGGYFSEQLGENLPPNFPVIDGWMGGVVTSIKSIDLNAITYQDAAGLTYRLNQYIDQLALYEGGELGVWKVDPSAISGRVLKVAIPKGSVTSAQQGAIEAAQTRAQAFDIELIFSPF